MAEKRFIKGLFKDTANSDQPEGSWRHATNMVVNETEGAISNEGGNIAFENPDIDKYESFMNQWVRMIPSINRHDTAFEDLNNREDLYRG